MNIVNLRHILIIYLFILKMPSHGRTTEILTEHSPKSVPYLKNNIVPLFVCFVHILNLFLELRFQSRIKSSYTQIKYVNEGIRVKSKFAVIELVLGRDHLTLASQTPTFRYCFHFNFAKFSKRTHAHV